MEKLFGGGGFLGKVFIIQDAAQEFHWNNQQATIHPFVSYFENSKHKLENLCFVFISDGLYHDTVTVYIFQKHLIAFLKENVPDISKIYYFSDSASAQYKNKNNFVNLCHHNTDFQINAEWHFFATSHGKGPCDGVRGTIKSCNSFQVTAPSDIDSSTTLFMGKDHFPSIHVQCVCNSEVEQTRHHLKFRFDNTRTVVSTRTCQYHAFLPISNTTLTANK
jgi:hypothetical protein